MSQAVPASSLEYAPTLTDQEQAHSRIYWRLVPFLCLLYIVNYLDRNNVAMATLRMSADIGLSDRAYGLGAGLFFVGYFIFELPSNLILERVGARIWLARIMISWGIISTAMMFVRGPTSFYVLRLLLGLAEAGFFPGVVLYLTYWVPSGRRAGAMAGFVTSTALSGVIGNPLAGALMKLDGMGGLYGWQWLFALEGIMPVVLGFVVLAKLPDRPAHAKWLTPEQRNWIEREVASEQHSSHHHVAEFWDAVCNPHLWLLSGIYFMFMMGFFGVIYWMPKMLKDASGASDFEVGLLSAIPYLLATICMVIIGHHADRHNERRWHATTTLLISAAGIAVIPLVHSTTPLLVCLCVAAIGCWSTIAPFWTLSTRYLQGGAAAGGIATVNSVGCLAGFASPYLMGWLKTETGTYTAGLLVIAASLVIGATMILVVPRSVDQTVEA